MAASNSPKHDFTSEDNRHKIDLLQTANLMFNQAIFLFSQNNPESYALARRLQIDATSWVLQAVPEDITREERERLHTTPRQDRLSIQARTSRTLMMGNESRPILRRAVAASTLSFLTMASWFATLLLLNLAVLVSHLNRDHQIHKKLWRLFDGLWRTSEGQLMKEYGRGLIVLASNRAGDVGGGIQDAFEGRGLLRALLE